VPQHVRMRNPHAESSFIVIESDLRQRRFAKYRDRAV